MSFERPLTPSREAEAPMLEQADLRRRQQEAERWAQALSTTLAVQPAPEPATQPENPSATPPTGTSDGSMTQAGAAAGSGEAKRSDEGDAVSRIRLDVSAGDLGELSLVVDRSDAGVRVFIGMNREGAKAMVEPERAVLEQALRAAGLSVRSVEVVSAHSLGTVLAKAQVRQRFSDVETAPERTNEERKRRNPRRLNLVG